MAAGHWDEAVPVAIEAARAAEADKAYADTAMLYERIVEHVPDPCERARVLSELGKAHFFAGETRRGQRYLEEGIAGLDRCNNERQAAGFRLWLGRCSWLQARPDLARAEYDRARVILEPFGPSADLAIAYVRLAGLAGFNKEHEVGEAKERMEHFEARFDPRGSRDPGFLQLQAFLAMRADGEPDRARPLLEAALPQADEVGETLFAARMRLDLAYVYTALDRIADA